MSAPTVDRQAAGLTDPVVMRAEIRLILTRLDLMMRWHDECMARVTQRLAALEAKAERLLPGRSW